MSVLKRVFLLSIAAFVLLPALSGATRSHPAAGPGPLVEVVAVLDAPALADAGGMRTLTAHGAARRLDLRAPAATSYLRRLASSQRALEAHLRSEIPGVVVRRRYGVVVDGLALVVPQRELAALERTPGIARVYPSVTYHALRSSTPGFIGAPAL